MITTLAVGVVAGADLWGELLLHVLLLAGFLGVLAFAMRIPEPASRGAYRHLLVIAVMFTLYMTLAHVAFAAVP